MVQQTFGECELLLISTYGCIEEISMARQRICQRQRIYAWGLNKNLTFANMTQSQIHQRINSEITKTEELIYDYQEQTKPFAAHFNDKFSRMDVITNKNVTESALRKAEDKLTMLKRVRLKIDHPDFGICTRCGRRIPLGRIIIKPESSHCVNCSR
jgi:DnaK suppressor protein